MGSAPSKACSAGHEALPGSSAAAVAEAVRRSDFKILDDCTAGVTALEHLTHAPPIFAEGPSAYFHPAVPERMQRLWTSYGGTILDHPPIIFRLTYHPPSPSRAATESLALVIDALQPTPCLIVIDPSTSTQALDEERERGEGRFIQLVDYRLIDAAIWIEDADVLDLSVEQLRDLDKLYLEERTRRLEDEEVVLQALGVIDEQPSTPMMDSDPCGGDPSELGPIQQEGDGHSIAGSASPIPSMERRSRSHKDEGEERGCKEDMPINDDTVMSTDEEHDVFTRPSDLAATIKPRLEGTFRSPISPSDMVTYSNPFLTDTWMTPRAHYTSSLGIAKKDTTKRCMVQFYPVKSDPAESAFLDTPTPKSRSASTALVSLHSPLAPLRPNQPGSSSSPAHVPNSSSPAPTDTCAKEGLPRTPDPGSLVDLNILVPSEQFRQGMTAEELCAVATSHMQVSIDDLNSRAEQQAFTLDSGSTTASPADESKDEAHGIDAEESTTVARKMHEKRQEVVQTVLGAATAGSHIRSSPFTASTSFGSQANADRSIEPSISSSSMQPDVQAKAEDSGSTNRRSSLRNRASLTNPIPPQRPISQSAASRRRLPPAPTPTQPDPFYSTSTPAPSRIIKRPARIARPDVSDTEVDDEDGRPAKISRTGPAAGPSPCFRPDMLPSPRPLIASRDATPFLLPMAPESAQHSAESTSMDTVARWRRKIPPSGTVARIESPTDVGCYPFTGSVFTPSQHTPRSDRMRDEDSYGSASRAQDVIGDGQGYDSACNSGVSDDSSRRQRAEQLDRMRQAGMVDAADQLDKSGDLGKVAGRRQQKTANRPSGKSGTGTLVGSMVSSESIVWNRLLGPDGLRYVTFSCKFFGLGICSLKLS